MHTQGGYLDQRKRSPISLAAALAINGAVLGALLTINTGVIDSGPTVIDTIVPTIAPDPVPPPPEPPRETRAAQQPQRQSFVTPTRTIIPLPTNRFETVITPPQLPTPPGREIEGLSVTPTPRPASTGIFVGPQLDRRFAAALQPPYPAGKIRNEEEGVVVVRVLIGPDGRVKRVEKVEAADDAFYQATLQQALKRWRFKPATRDGVAVEGWRTMTVRFEIDS